MAKLSFETLAFRKNGDVLHVDLLKLFTTIILSKEVEKIAPFTITSLHSIAFKQIEQQKAEKKISFLLNNHFDHLTNKLTGNKATYIHKNSGIPLIGNPAFGIVYRDSSIIEIKPVTSCNLNCIYCSISEGLSSKKNDFVVEKDYLVEELKKLLDFISEPVEIHIGVQGEPFLYADIDNLIADLQKMSNVHTISIDTNGTFLNKQRIDSLAKYSKLQLNFSLDAIDPEIAKKMAGTKNYNVYHTEEMIAYTAQKMNVIVAPILVDGYNNQEMEKIIAWVKTLKKKPTIGIQNFLRYKTGRNPAKELPWDAFYTLLKKLEKKHQIKLKMTKEDFNIKPTKPLPKPFRSGEVLTATVKCHDRFINTTIAVAKERNISVPNCQLKKNKIIKIKIVRDKHNIFTGKLM